MINPSQWYLESESDLGPKGEEGGCQYCGYADCSGELRWVADPFLAEIYDEIEMCWLCPGRYGDISDEI